MALFRLLGRVGLVLKLFDHIFQLVKYFEQCFSPFFDGTVRLF